jgi:hypothetical protein
MCTCLVCDSLSGNSYLCPDGAGCLSRTVGQKAWRADGLEFEPLLSVCSEFQKHLDSPSSPIK